MSKRKGMSMDEKLRRMTELFIQSRDFFQLKEVEKRAVKEKGLSGMQVKDLVQALVDDNIVTCEKIGTSNYFWAFSSEVAKNKRRKLANVNLQVEEATRKLQSLKKEWNANSLSESERLSRIELKSKIDDKLKIIKNLELKVSQLKSYDIDYIHSIERDIEKYREDINVCTDNVFQILKWCSEKNPAISQRDLCQEIGIPEDLEYFE